MSDDAKSPATPCSFVGFEKDARGCYPVTALVFGTKDCEVPAGACFSSTNADEPPPPEPRRKPKRKHEPMSDPATAPIPKAAADHADEATIPDDHADDFAAEVSPAPAYIAQPAQPVPQTAAGELSGLVPQGGGGAISVLLALIAVAGGGAGWKFYQSFAKQKHEERMKQLEIEATRVEKVEAVQAEAAAEKAEAARESKDDSHEKCSAERAALEGKVEALEARLAEAEKAAREAAEAARAATTTVEAIEKPKEVTIDFDDIEQRISEIERALKKAPSDKAKKPSKKDAKKA